MSCTNCNNGNPSNIYSQQATYPLNCNNNPECGGGLLSSKCVYYNGPNLPCSGINTTDSLELALQKIDEQICVSAGDYSTYNVFCLAPISTQQEFVEAICSFVCDTKESLDTFIDDTFTEYQDALDVRIGNLEIPGITCSIASVTNTDTLVQILNKYCTTFSTLNTKISLLDVTWNSCFTVAPTPTTIGEGFNVVLDQICQLKSASTSLPTFNNVGTCLPSPGASDSLVNTIEKIKTRLCQTGTFDPNTISWGCTSAQTSLQNSIQTLITSSNDWKQNKPTYSEDFVVTLNDEEDPCQGVTISLATPIDGNDRFVATSATDTTPGTLIQKLNPGSAKITIVETGSNPSKQITIDTTAIDVVSTTNTASVVFSGNGTTGAPLSATVSFPASSESLQTVTNVGNSTTNNIIITYNGGTTITSGESASSLNCILAPTSSSGSVDFYGTASTLSLDLTSTSISGSNTFNRTGLYGALVVNGNNGVSTSAPLQAIRGAVVLTNSKLDRISVLEAKTPAMYGSNSITNLIGCYIEPLSQTGIVNAYSIYQEGVGDKNFYAGKTVYDNTTTATVGNVTINKPSGKVIMADTGTTVTVTNSFVTTNSIVIPIIQTSPLAATTCIKSCSVANGSFTIEVDVQNGSGNIVIAWVVYN